ncbi:MAG: hypothetical protein K2W82_14045 [Candidatus Obscuribacterales bacterium]|nr:hypothetical protein [Candidatus Obscuribacterales bacterium]
MPRFLGTSKSVMPEDFVAWLHAHFEAISPLTLTSDMFEFWAVPHAWTDDTAAAQSLAGGRNYYFLGPAFGEDQAVMAMMPAAPDPKALNAVTSFGPIRLNWHQNFLDWLQSYPKESPGILRGPGHTPCGPLHQGRYGSFYMVADWFPWTDKAKEFIGKREHLYLGRKRYDNGIVLAVE